MAEIHLYYLNMLTASIKNSRKQLARSRAALRAFLQVLVACAWLVVCGCGTTKSFTATEQLLLSDAVDATVSKLDFTPIANRKVYLDSTYLRTAKGPLLIDSDYVISSLRQQMLSVGVLLVESREEADLVVEARIGALGMNGHDVVYGIPASSALSSASAAIVGAPALPSIPEISFARREGRQGAAKIAVFAYDRVTREPYWQSGIAKSKSTSRDMWLFGVGPFQAGTIHDKTRFAGSDVLGTRLDGESDAIRQSKNFADYSLPRRYFQPPEPQLADERKPATGDAQIAAEAPANPPNAEVATSPDAAPIR